MSEEPKKSRVVIAVDGSEHSDRAFDFYSKSMHRKDDEVLLIHANDFADRHTQEHHHNVATVESLDRWLERCTKESKKLLSSFEKKCKENKFNCKLFTKIGKPGEVICEFMEEKNADQIVLGCRGQDTLRRTLMGSVSDYCIRHATKPVTVVPPPNRESHGFINRANNAD
ncbi:predicted protein [Nematostella vectensis]|uniref:UspA domain-containing protein n=1 Tax=Nematostella vectensis TaxID=45351 RepID=A7SNQ4_NEMVE|nr:universal stress protein Slr1101 [Nematostella vectensis]EDO34657.1 predicted protein [Nematostella vectensis]|eukprot:XP_001626757.1 predicted protein [Nematostella vectensis]